MGWWDLILGKFKKCLNVKILCVMILDIIIIGKDYLFEYILNVWV